MYKLRETKMEIDFSELSFRYRLVWAVKILLGIKTRVKRKVKLL